LLLPWQWMLALLTSWELLADQGDTRESLVIRGFEVSGKKVLTSFVHLIFLVSF
jgi:hypothetical protein